MTRRAERIPGGPLSMEIEMNPKPMHRNLFASTAVAIGVAVSLTAYAAQPDAAGNAAPILLAQAGAPTSTAAMQGVAIDPDLGAVNLRGVRKAGARTITSAVRGQMHNAATRSEAMALIHRNG